MIGGLLIVGVGALNVGVLALVGHLHNRRHDAARKETS